MHITWVYLYQKRGLWEGGLLLKVSHQPIRFSSLFPGLLSFNVKMHPWFILSRKSNVDANLTSNMAFVFLYKSLCHDHLVYMNGYVYNVFADVMLLDINNTWLIKFFVLKQSFRVERWFLSTTSLKDSVHWGSQYCHGLSFHCGSFSPCHLETWLVSFLGKGMQV